MRKLLAVAAILVAVVFVANAATADSVLHLALDKSMPEADQVVTEAPSKIVFEFTQKPELAVSRVALKSGDHEVALGDVTASEDDETILWVSVDEPLADGAYTVTWLTGSGDGHPVRGEFAFSVKATR